MKAYLLLFGLLSLNSLCAQNTKTVEKFPFNIVSKYYGESFNQLSQEKQQAVVNYLTKSYQITYVGENFNPSTFDIVQYESSRKENEDVIVQLKDGTTIKIFSHNNLSTPIVELRKTFVY